MAEAPGGACRPRDRRGRPKRRRRWRKRGGGGGGDAAGWAGRQAAGQRAAATLPFLPGGAGEGSRARN